MKKRNLAVAALALLFVASAFSDLFSQYSYVSEPDIWNNRIVKKESGWGLVDYRGEPLISCIHDSLYYDSNLKMYVGRFQILVSYFTISGTLLKTESALDQDYNNSYSAPTPHQNQWVSCPSCHGTGKGDIRFPPAYNGKNYYMDINQKCSKHPYCSERLIHSHDPCRRCHGRGKIQQ